MNIKTAFNVLGMDSDTIFLKMSMMTRNEKIFASDKILLEAKKKARILMAKHHPDRGGDSEKFKEVNNAMEVIEKSTEKFKSSMAKIIEDAKKKEESSIRIEITK